jgi:hypothetical protein
LALFEIQLPLFRIFFFLVNSFYPRKNLNRGESTQKNSLNLSFFLYVILMSFGFSLVDAYIIHSRNFTCICNDWRLTHSSEICFIYILAVRFLVQCTQSVIGEKNRQEKRQHDREKKTRKKKNGRRVDLLVESLHYYGCLVGMRKQKNKDMAYAVCILGMSMHTFILFFLDSHKIWHQQLPINHNQFK